ncbi:hypothetical protein [Capnocytophaga bilenii]
MVGIEERDISWLRVSFILTAIATKKNYSVGSQQRTSESGYAEANAKAELIADEKEKRIGIQGELGAKAGVGRAGGEATTDILGVLKVKANVEGEREAAGISAEYISNALGLIAPRDGTLLTGSSTVIIGG